MIVDRIQREHGLTGLLHLTCVNATTAQIAGVVEQARNSASGTSWPCAAIPPAAPRVPEDGRRL